MPQMMPINWILIFISNIHFVFMVMVYINSINIPEYTKFSVVGKSLSVEKFPIEWK